MGRALRPPLSRRARAVAPFLAMDLLARARDLEAAGRDIIHLEVGEPDFPTPDAVQRRAAVALEKGRTRYTPALGLPALRRAIARFYAEEEGVEVDWQRVVITPGASGATLLALTALLDPGDGLLLSDPGYPANRHLAALLSASVQTLMVTPQSGFQPTVEQVASAWRRHSRVLLLTSPANPTGAVIDEARLRALLAQVKACGGVVLMDEIYRGLMYGPPVPSALALDAGVWVINSFSKYFGMTGWRLGWMVVPEEAVETVDRLAQNVFLAPSTLAQEAAMAALEKDTLDELACRREVFRQRRDFLFDALTRLGFHIPVSPQGAFYLYADCSAHGGDAMALAQRFLEEGGVAVTPGVDFGESPVNRRFIRFAYTTHQRRLQEAVDRLARLL